MKLLFVGDIVGRPGRNFVKTHLAKIRQEQNIDLIIINGENSAGGAGITASIANDLKEAGADAITLGDHVWDQRGFLDDIDGLDYVCRPANIPAVCPGKDFLVIEKDGKKIGVFTVMGRTFMNKKAECPFLGADRMIEKIKSLCDYIVVEIHAEATSEKVALGRYLDGRVALVVGTHTHIPTADVTVLPGGTGYITDIGMTGPHDSVIGIDKDIIINQFLDGIPRRYEVAKEDVRLHGCMAEIVEGKTKEISLLTVRGKDVEADE